jgi:IS30 family transposase
MTYTSYEAQKKADQNKVNSHKKRKLNHSLINWVVNLLRYGLSPETIAAISKYKSNSKNHISHETIYRYIYSFDGRKQNLYQYLIYGKKNRSKHKGKYVHSSKIPFRVSISKRPVEANNRLEIGHFEVDSIESSRKISGAIRTFVDRKSRMLFIEKVKDLTSKEGLRADIKVFSKIPKSVLKTVTYDNGREHHLHYKLIQKFGLKTYFCHPYCSSERGTNENTNGLIRRYYPKGTNFEEINNDDLQFLAMYLNNKPRKCLGYKSPQQVWNKELEHLGLRS